MLSATSRQDESSTAATPTPSDFDSQKNTEPVLPEGPSGKQSAALNPCDIDLRQDIEPVLLEGLN